MSTIEIEGDTSPHEIFADFALQFDDLMRPQTTEKYLYGGDTSTFNFTVKQSGAAMNLTGLSLSFAAKLTTASTAFLWNVTPTISSDATLGTATVNVTIPGLTVGGYTVELAVWNGGTKQTAIQFPIYIGGTVA